MKLVKCSWCETDFYADETKNPRTGNYRTLTCEHCGRLVNSSIKELTGEVIGRTHIHRALKDGDVV